MKKTKKEKKWVDVSTMDDTDQRYRIEMTICSAGIHEIKEKITEWGLIDKIEMEM